MSFMKEEIVIFVVSVVVYVVMVVVLAVVVVARSVCNCELEFRLAEIVAKVLNHRELVL